MTKIFRPLIIIVSILFFSCASAGNSGGLFSSFGKQPPPPEPVAAPEEFNFWRTLPTGGDLVIIGVAAPQSTRAKAIQLALEDAARKVSIFNRVEGYIVQEEQNGLGAFAFQSSNAAQITYDEENYLGFVESLKYDPDVDVVVDGRGVYVRTRYTPGSPVDIPYYGYRNAAKPAWIADPPSEIAGFRAGVGHSNPKNYYRDAIYASFQTAIGNIIKNLSSQVVANRALKDGTGSFNIQSDSSSKIISRATLSGFYVLETWIDPSNNEVWTLAIFKDAQY